MSTQEFAGPVLNCRHGTCGFGLNARPATMLVSFCGKPYLPSCDKCARATYERHPDSTLMAPLSEYVDMFAAAKEAALATPEQVISPDQPVIEPVAVYQAPAEPAEPAVTPEPAAGKSRPGLLRKAALIIADGDLDSFKPSSGYVHKPMGKTAKTWAWAAGSVGLGIFFCAVSAPDGEVSDSHPGPLMIPGILMIVMPLLIGAIILVAGTAKLVVKEINAERAWKATLTPDQRLAVKAAETAALYAAWAGAHHWVKESNAKSAAAYQERSAKTRAGMAAFQQHRQAQQQQEQQAAPVRHNPGVTRRSDIYGNYM